MTDGHSEAESDSVGRSGTGSDSAGQPWAGRAFQPNPASDDDGSADPGLIAALTAFRAGSSSPLEVLAALASARLLVPLLAHAGEVGFTPDGHQVDKTQELSLVTVQGPDGRPVLPAFTSVDAMRAWNAIARPVPATAVRVALAAIDDGSLVVIDPTSPTEFALRRPALTALVTGVPWVPCWQDSDLLPEFAAAAAPESAVAALDLLPGDPDFRLTGAELVAVVRLEHGVSDAEVHALIVRLHSAWQASELIAERVDSLTLQVVPA